MWSHDKFEELMKEEEMLKEEEMKEEFSEMKVFPEVLKEELMELTEPKGFPELKEFTEVKEEFTEAKEDVPEASKQELVNEELVTMDNTEP